MPEYAGQVVATQTISLRFPESGKLAWLKCHPGQIVKKGDQLAGLDPSPVQTLLDIELADFRRIRAEFDQLSRQIPGAKTEDDKTKKEIAQSKLDVSVKTVEKFKHQLDSLILYAPLDAVIIATESLAPGVNLTPGSFPIILSALDTVVFEIAVSEENLYSLSPGQKSKIYLKNGQVFDSEIIYLSPRSENGNGFFTTHFRLPRMDLNNFRLGTSGKVAL